MRILLVGGGSGGHVTPLKAIAHQLRIQNPSDDISVITNREFSDQANMLFSGHKDIKVHSIFAGKYRRYHSKSALWHILHMPTLLKNIRDVFYLGIGFMQSMYLVAIIKPDVVFCKGGFVCIPVGLASRLLNKKIIIHDSDTRPGLTNRILSRWASVIATGMPTEFYPYEQIKMRYLGMPVDPQFTVLTDAARGKFKQQLGFEASQKILLVTGGGNGADSLNKKVSEIVGELINQKWGIIHVAGPGKVAPLMKIRDKLPIKMQQNWHIEEFVDMVPRILAADMVVARTSASTLQECANCQKVVIGIPSPHLEDQNMNAEYFASKEAIEVFSESRQSSHELLVQIESLYADVAGSSKLAQNLHQNFAKPNAAKNLATIINRGK